MSLTDAAALGRTARRLDSVASALFADGVKVFVQTNIGSKSFSGDKMFHALCPESQLQASCGLIQLKET